MNLEELNLENNPIKSLSRDSFRNLQKLRYLNIIGNFVFESILKIGALDNLILKNKLEKSIRAIF